MVKVNDMFYGYSANEDIKAKGEYGGVVTTIMKYLLEENRLCDNDFKSPSLLTRYYKLEL